MPKHPARVVSEAQQSPNGDIHRQFPLTDGSGSAVGIGSFHKSLPHDACGEVDVRAFTALNAARISGDFSAVPPLPPASAPLANPRGGLATDRLTDPPRAHVMPAAPRVLSDATAAEMTELYWMALLRDVPFNEWNTDARILDATRDINAAFNRALDASGTKPADRLWAGIDTPGAPAGQQAADVFTRENLFRLGLPGEEVGPMLSQFFMRPVVYGTQTIDARQRPYRAGKDYLTHFDAWLHAQNTGRDAAGQAYPQANEDSDDNYEEHPRYISTMRDLARFVNKDALHQAYFNAALLMLTGGAAWAPGNPYHAKDLREAGFGVMGGPHILALVSEVATRALKIVWFQKWQTHLRLRPEAYGGLVHVQQVGAPMADGTLKKRAYGLPAWLYATEAAQRVKQSCGSYLLPMAFSPGSPTHPAYGAGHATVAGACVTVLKAWFALLDGSGKPLPLSTLGEGDQPYGAKPPMRAYVTGRRNQQWQTIPLGHAEAGQLTIEGELNKLAQNVAMGRTMGGVHWRTDNARSLMLGEAIAARLLCDITEDAAEHPMFKFRSFARKADGKPKIVTIEGGEIRVDGIVRTGTLSEL